MILLDKKKVLKYVIGKMSRSYSHFIKIAYLKFQYQGNL